jgi:non-heme chloroperoxidase
MHGDEDQMVPFSNAGALTAKLMKDATFQVYFSYPHGMPMTHTDIINDDMLAFIKG